MEAGAVLLGHRCGRYGGHLFSLPGGPECRHSPCKGGQGSGTVFVGRLSGYKCLILGMLKTWVGRPLQTSIPVGHRKALVGPAKIPRRCSCAFRGTQILLQSRGGGADPVAGRGGEGSSASAATTRTPALARVVTTASMAERTGSRRSNSTRRMTALRTAPVRRVPDNRQFAPTAAEIA
jgi:hypothetical protein